MNLYLRLLKLLWCLPFMRRQGVFDAGRICFRVWPTDCDLNLHMNNGRYLTLMDLGRMHLLAQTGLLRHIVRRGWHPVLAAAEITFVRALTPLQRFTVVTRILGWDEKYFYLEQRFERRGALCAVSIVKGLFVGSRGRITPAETVAALGIEDSPPPLPVMVQHWNDLTELKKEHARTR